MGLGNISITGNYPEVSKDIMLSKLNILKEPFLENFNPNINDRIDRIKRIQKLVEENIEAFHKSLREDFGSRHEQLSLMADTMPVINNAKHALKNIKNLNMVKIDNVEKKRQKFNQKYKIFLISIY